MLCYLAGQKTPLPRCFAPNKIIIILMRQAKPMYGPPVSPPLVGPNSSPARLLQQRLKKELSIKFKSNPRADQTNRSSSLPTKKHHSLLLSNPLTKSSFSLTDALTHKHNRDVLQPVRHAAKSLSSKKIIALSSRQHCASFDQGFFKTGATLNQRDPPRLEPKRIPHSSIDVNKPVRGASQRNNKFKLLIKERNSQYKSASQRKIARIDSKINLLRQKRTFLQSLLPVDKPKPQIMRPQPKRYSFGEEELREKITKMVNQLIRTIELFFNMYVHNNIVGGHLRKVEGYGRRIREILMFDDARARRITDPKDITKHFQVFGAGNKSQTFMEEDVGLLSILSNFLMKMEMKYNDIVEGFNYYEHKRKKDEKEAFRKTRERFEQRMGQHQPINRINHFIENRLRFDQSRREDYMQNLQKRGVVLNLIQRSRQLILREKQNAVKEAFRK